MHNPRPLTDNTVLITGAASGIGRSLCHRLSDQGASLALIDRDRGALDDLAR
jgi:meso-butanediol dehydrogenase/(S,S)-butanediol dehydrogenase/diacetyl reductase